MMGDDTTTDPRAEGQRLLEIWERLARTHMMAGGGCACGAGGVAIVLEDFEQDIADYIHAETVRLGRADVQAYLEAHGREGEIWSISKLLSALSQEDGAPVTAAPDEATAGFVLQRLGRTLQSFETLHGSA